MSKDNDGHNPPHKHRTIGNEMFSFLPKLRIFCIFLLFFTIILFPPGFLEDKFQG